MNLLHHTPETLQNNMRYSALDQLVFVEMNSSGPLSIPLSPDTLRICDVFSYQSIFVQLMRMLERAQTSLDITLEGSY